MFDINEKVKICITQNNITGKIKGILTPDLYLLLNNKLDQPDWNNAFPDWKSKCVYMVELDDPCKHITYENYRNFYLHEDEEIVKSRYKCLPLYNWFNTPEDDLEIYYEDKSYIKE